MLGLILAIVIAILVAAWLLRSQKGALQALSRVTNRLRMAKLDREVLPRMVRNNSLRPGVIAADDYCRAALLRCDFALQGILPTRKSPVGPEIRIAQTVERLFPRFGALNGQLYRDTIAAVPELRIHDLTRLLDASDRPFFVDVAHMNEAGYRLVAEALVPIILKGQAEAARAQQPTHSR